MKRTERTEEECSVKCARAANAARELTAPHPLGWLRAARLLPTDLRADVVFAWKDPDNTALIAAYAGWPVYQWNNDRLEPYRASR